MAPKPEPHPLAAGRERQLRDHVNKVCYSLRASVGGIFAVEKAYQEETDAQTAAVCWDALLEYRGKLKQALERLWLMMRNPAEIQLMDADGTKCWLECTSEATRYIHECIPLCAPNFGLDLAEIDSWAKIALGLDRPYEEWPVRQITFGLPPPQQAGTAATAPSSTAASSSSAAMAPPPPQAVTAGGDTGSTGYNPTPQPVPLATDAAPPAPRPPPRKQP